MNCKGSPVSNISTGIAASPQQKLKFSRKFVINLNEPQENHETNNLERKLLRYKKRYIRKKSKVSEEIKRNKEFKQELDFEQDQIRSLTKELDKEFSIHSKLLSEKAGIEKSTQKITEILNSDTFNMNSKGLEGSDLYSAASSRLEELQEHLFISNKKASDLERLLAREQKKNENLAKELKMLKIDLSSKLSVGKN